MVRSQVANPASASGPILVDILAAYTYSYMALWRRVSERDVSVFPGLLIKDTDHCICHGPGPCRTDIPACQGA